MSVMLRVRIPGSVSGVSERVCVCVCLLLCVWERKPTHAALVITVGSAHRCPSSGASYGNIKIEAGPRRAVRATRRKNLIRFV